MTKLELSNLNFTNSNYTDQLANNTQIKELTEADMTTIVGGIDIKGDLINLAVKGFAALLNDVL